MPRMLAHGVVNRPLTLIFLMAAAGALAISSSGSAQTSEREVFTAFAVSTGGPRTAPVAEQVIFTVETWSTDEQARALSDALKEGGSEAMLEALRDLPEVGRFRTPDGLGYPLRFADQQALPEGGRRIMLATDRPVQFWETWRSSPTLEYPFTFVELHVDEDGTGEGKLSRAARVIALRDRILLENWASAPVQLTNVTTDR